MLQRHPNAAVRTAQQGLAKRRSPQTTPDLFPESRWVGGPGEKPEVEEVQGSKPVPNNANRSNWETVALWLFIAGIFIASVVAGHLFWIKLSFRSP